MLYTFFKKVGEFRVRYLAYLALCFFLINIGLRIVLQVAFLDTMPVSASMFPNLLKGFLNDCATLVFVLLLPALMILLPTNTFLQRRVGKCYSLLIIFSFSIVFIFTAFAEFLFWDEFNCRFNFIAVDYLIYTTEVIHNIIESYPMDRLLLTVFFLAMAITALLWNRLHIFLSPKQPNYSVANDSLWGRLGILSGLCTGSVLLFFLFTPFAGDQNRVWNEYAKNGIYEIFSAYLNNELDYRAFYKTIDKGEAFSLVQGEILDTNAIFESGKNESLVRIVTANNPEQTPNIIIIVMESMGNNWLGEHTPYLNALADNGLSFTNMMSTGTRTVRGLEAIMLSIPPTPGNSIVRRPDNDMLFNLGTMFSQKGYSQDFIYGGIGFFDNMNAFFAGNGYRVTDKLGFSKQNKTFANAWGQCDEDLYSESIRLADESFQAGKLFKQVLLTTSNHRPFTFPEGKINMKSGSRQAAIQYSDYAVGKFICEAQEKPWFGNTIFVFVGDHPSSIAGKTDVPADAYGIVCIMYGPKFFKPEKIETLCSQIDVAPTLLASLGWTYCSQFFGRDARGLPAEAGRAWISTYQLLGFRTTDRLVVLKPDKSATVTYLDPAQLMDKYEDSALIFRAVASYQSAYDLFTDKKMKEDTVINFVQKRSVKTNSEAGQSSRQSIQPLILSKKDAGLLVLLFTLGNATKNH